MGQVIKCNKKNLKTDIGDISGAIKKIDTEIDAIRDLIKRLDAMWDGASSEIFETRAIEHARDLEDLCNMLNGILMFENSAHTAYTRCENRVGNIVAAINV